MLHILMPQMEDESTIVHTSVNVCITISYLISLTLFSAKIETGKDQLRKRLVPFYYYKSTLQIITNLTLTFLCTNAIS